MTVNPTILQGQHALVTGGSRGIGAAIAQRLAAHGARVTLVARDSAAAKRTADAIGGRAEQADVTQQEDVLRAFASAEAVNGPVSILINNVGAVETAPFARTDRAMWQRMFDVNVMPPYWCTQRALPGMLEARNGRVVNVASAAGLRGYPYVSAYVAAKHAVVGLTRALALETANKGVTVNAVCPGFADTDLTRRSAAAVSERTGKPVEEILAAYAKSNPHGRLVQPSEVADRVLWFCLPEQVTVTGCIVAVDGSEADLEVP